MYISPAFNEGDLARQHALIRAYPLGLLVSSSSTGLQATPLPFNLLADGPSLGTLQGHLARPNTHWEALDDAEVLVVFQSPDAYITPSWYPSKADSGKVVPTWNYVMVQVRGRVQVIHDAEWLRAHVTRLTDQHEGGREKPWHVDDAPSAFIDAHLKGIVGLQIVISSIEAKAKVSQNRSLADRAGVAHGLEQDGQAEMSALVRHYGQVPRE